MSIDNIDPSAQSPIPSPSTEPRLRTTPHRSWPRTALVPLAGAALLLGAVAVSADTPGTPTNQLAAAVASVVRGAAPPTALAQTLSQDPQTAAIQQVIQLANDEQTQAIIARDPSAMRDTATDDHYQQLAQVNQDLLDQGVSQIKLASINWGPISVTGSTATATTSETWTTSFSDGTTMQSTDTNNYNLVQQNGTWVVSDDQQPSAQANQPGGPAAASANPTGPGSTMPASPAGRTRPGAPSTTPGANPGQATPSAPSAPGSSLSPSADTSRNWAGYAATDGNYTNVSGTWTVPQPSAIGAPGVGATWVGIGGITSHDLIQAGTQDVSSGSGQTQYQAWIEMLPQASRQIPLAVSPGDSVTVSIDEQSAGSGVWQIKFVNNTTGKTYQTNVRYSSTESSVEWVEEAPASNAGLLPLDNFDSVAFTSATATRNGQSINLSQASAQPITMLNGSGQPLAVPSAIASDGAGFSVDRTSAASTPSTGRGAAGTRPSPFGTAPTSPAPSRGVGPGVSVYFD